MCAFIYHDFYGLSALPLCSFISNMKCSLLKEDDFTDFSINRTAIKIVIKININHPCVGTKCIAITFDFFETLLGHCRPFFHSSLLLSLFALCTAAELRIGMSEIYMCTTQAAAVLPCFMDEEKNHLSSIRL